MGDRILVDTNVLLRHLLGDIPDQSRHASTLFSRAKAGVASVYLPATVWLEASYVLTIHKGVPSKDVANAFLAILDFPGIETDHPEALPRAMEMWSHQGPLSFADCFHLALTRELGMTQIYTFDKKMDRYPDVERVEPGP